MKKTKSISSLFGQVSLVGVLLAAFVFSAGNGFYYHFMAEGQGQNLTFIAQAQENVQNQDDIQDQAPGQQDDDRPLTYISYAYNALLPGVAQVHIWQAAYFQVILPPVLNSLEKPQTLSSIQGNPYFRTLFRRIISPNAP